MSQSGLVMVRLTVSSAPFSSIRAVLRMPFTSLAAKRTLAVLPAFAAAALACFGVGKNMGAIMGALKIAFPAAYDGKLASTVVKRVLA